MEESNERQEGEGMRCGAVKERKEKKKSDVCVMYSQHSVMRNRYTDLADREHYCIASITNIK